MSPFGGMSSRMAPVFDHKEVMPDGLRKYVVDSEAERRFGMTPRVVQRHNLT